MADEHSEIDVARLMRLPGHRRSELQQQPDAMRASDGRQSIEIHGSIIDGAASATGARRHTGSRFDMSRSAGSQTTWTVMSAVSPAKSLAFLV